MTAKYHEMIEPMRTKVYVRYYINIKLKNIIKYTPPSKLSILCDIIYYKKCHKLR